MKKTRRISVFVIIFIMLIVSILVGSSIMFYKSTNRVKPDEVKIDPAIDSAVQATTIKVTSHFDSVIRVKENQLSDKLNVIKDKDSTIWKLTKIRDSLSYKLDYFKQRNRELQNKDTVRN